MDFQYTSEVCNKHRSNCRTCPIFNLCHENVPVSNEKLEDWENRIEDRAKEVVEKDIKQMRCENCGVDINEKVNGIRVCKSCYEKLG